MVELPGPDGRGDGVQRRHRAHQEFRRWRGCAAGVYLFHGLLAVGAARPRSGAWDGATLIAYAFGGTALIFAGMAAIASSIKTSLSGMGRFLWIGVCVILLSAAIGGIVFQMPALMITCSVLFIVCLFAAWTVYDLNQIITGGETNYITATLSIYVNLFNIFSNLLSLLWSDQQRLN